ncbi:C4-dicarboxylate TRAP transporter substrate-binding protein [Candidatus Galacturonibacter soehngenii]|uniref:C4-dicarboxylate ABC transporter n=1 Tax=Candidatus Galacturonatibacter soehngenii TaxID=2307010 RepID=A0A7V7QIM6_9FIRM|nr:C4-dicarboxylate TRAP transporter substrate-binding protein [Candidatus Galacturonibacter soehngenii]KAB1436063.1 C4-dicarboxylate ABC transporter [Candidatus Galacturonibacter soehngenii]MBA4686198.1 TRAP transporter substrate-binding protein DctP [Candidatus Galacturonibacter soehngenii]
MKKLLSIVLAGVLTVSLTACAGKGSSSEVESNSNETTKTDSKAEVAATQGKYTLKIGTALSENDPLYQALENVFEKNVEEQTNGEVQVEIYSSSQLGSDEDVLEQALVGAGVGIITDPGRLSNYVYDFGVLQAPYIADSYEEVLKLFATDVYKDLCSQIEQQGFNILSFNYYQGERELFTKKPIVEPSDLKGQRIRSSGSQVVTATLEAMGANTTVLAWSEAYQALQQQVIEGVEVHLSAAVGSSMQEVTKYLSFTGHQQLLTALVISDAWMKSLPEEYQTILIDQSYKAGTAASEAVLAKNEEYLRTLKEGGIEVIECNKEAFKEACNIAYETLGYTQIKAKLDAELGR